MPTKLMFNCSDELWNSFKEIVPKSKTMNEAVTDLIQDAVDDNAS